VASRRVIASGASRRGTRSALGRAGDAEPGGRHRLQPGLGDRAAAPGHAELDEELLKEIARAAAETALEVVRIRGDLDHGTAVPL